MASLTSTTVANFLRDCPESFLFLAGLAELSCNFSETVYFATISYMVDLGYPLHTYAPYVVLQRGQNSLNHNMSKLSNGRFLTKWVVWTNAPSNCKMYSFLKAWWHRSHSILSPIFLETAPSPFSTSPGWQNFLQTSPKPYISPQYRTW